MFKIRKIITSLLVVSPILLVGCNSGATSTQSSAQDDNNLFDLAAFTQSLVVNGDSYPSVNYQHSFMVPESVTMYNVNVVYFADESCTKRTTAVVLGASGKPVSYAPNRYSTTPVSLASMLGLFNWGGYIGAGGEWVAVLANYELKSMRYEYTFSKNNQYLVSYGNCKYNKDIGTEGIADYTYAYGTSQFCADPYQCGYSKQYESDILETASAWVFGSNTINQSGSYGIQDVPSRDNTLGARSRGGVFYDQSGNVYVFGGYGIGQNGTVGYLNDMWQYTPKANTWTWVSGSQQANPGPSFGGVPLYESDFAYWTVPNSDGSSSFYTFGGNSTSPYANYSNKMLSYNTKSKSWASILGSTSSNNQNVNEMTTIPGATSGASSVKIGTKLYLFGGYGFIYGTTPGLKNELWVYDTANPTAQWKRLTGSTQLNVLATASAPGARQHAAMWAGSDGMIYVYGGTGYLNKAPTDIDSCPIEGCQISDMWKYDPNTNQWSNISQWGDASNGAYSNLGSHGTRLYGAVTNNPGSRDSAVTWTDSQGNLWLFGGFVTIVGYDLVYLNDLWKYTPGNGKWTWVSGDAYDTISMYQLNYGNNGKSEVYGVRNLASNGSQPGSKAGAMGIADNTTGNLWLIGGYGYAGNNQQTGYLNSVWKITPLATY